MSGSSVKEELRRQSSPVRLPDPVVSLVIPFVDNRDITLRCVEVAASNVRRADTQIVLFDNGSDDPTIGTDAQLVAAGFGVQTTLLSEEENIGVLPVFPKSLMVRGEILAFIHNDVLLHDAGWDEAIVTAFENDPKVGLAGIFGGTGIGSNGGRIRAMGNMLGQEWGSCECHDPVQLHHGEHIPGQVHPAGVLDGVGMFFRREVLEQLVNETDSFADWRAPHHFYDRFLVCKVVDLGHRVVTLGIGFDHWSGATANSSEKYHKVARDWAERNHIDQSPYSNPDEMVYLIAEQQFFNEYGRRLPMEVFAGWQYKWLGTNEVRAN